MLKARTGEFDIPQIPANLQARLTGARTVTLTWPKTKIEGETYTLKSYNIYGGGKLLGNVPFDASKDNYEYVVENAQEGYIQYAISGVYSSGKIKKLESPKSDFSVAAVPNTFSLPLFEGLESGSWNSNYWMFTKEVENNDLYNYWGTLKYLGFKGFAGSASLNTTKPYSLSATSRPMDATQANGKIHVAFAMKYGIFEGSSTYYSQDSVSLDLSTDWGKTWKEVTAWTAGQLSGFYNFESADITSHVAGKTFQIRFRAHGQGKAQLRFFIDQISVQEESDDAPTGIIAYDLESEGRKLVWKNSNGAYELNYMGNPYGNALGKTIGNEGNEIIGANLYEADMLAPFTGKYLTAVTTALNWYDNEKTPEGNTIDAEVMVWEDNVLVREQKIDSPAFNQLFTVLLNEPLQIDGTKPLKIGIKVSNYGANQLPLLYLNSMSYVTGKSDLYSEDGGKTWNTLLKTFENSENPDDGMGAWRISGNITDEPVVNNESIFNDTLVAYNIYRDGKKINRQMIYSLQARFMEENPPVKGDYEVRAYYINGGVSPLSEELKYEASAIADNLAKQFGVAFDPESETITIEGDFTKANIYSMSGQFVVSSTDPVIRVPALSKGIYLLRIESDDWTETYKI